MRPYFETKVVKVKKGKEKYSLQIIIDGKKYTLCKEEYLHKEKGNWVNGENLDKIKFPCFCSFTYFGEKLLGQINHSENGDFPYEIVGMGKQRKTNVYRHSDSLKELIISHKIKILKGKIIIFEEEDTNLKESVDGLED